MYQRFLFIQSRFIALKILCVLHIHSFLLLTLDNHSSSYCPYSFTFSRTSYSCDPIVHSLSEWLWLLWFHCCVTSCTKYHFQQSHSVGQGFKQGTALLWSVMSGATGRKTQRLSLGHHRGLESSGGSFSLRFGAGLGWLGLPVTFRVYMWPFHVACASSQCGSSQVVISFRLQVWVWWWTRHFPYNPPSKSCGITAIILYQSKQSQAHPESRRRDETAASQWRECQRICKHFLVVWLLLCVYLTSLKMALSFWGPEPYLTLPFSTPSLKQRLEFHLWLNDINILIWAPTQHCSFLAGLWSGLALSSIPSFLLPFLAQFLYLLHC